jgi:hypothetical protein
MRHAKREEHATDLIVANDELANFSNQTVSREWFALRNGLKVEGLLLPGISEVSRQ